MQSWFGSVIHRDDPKADIDMMRAVRDTAAKLGVVLHNHIIVARVGHTSFKSLGLL